MKLSSTMQKTLKSLKKKEGDPFTEIGTRKRLHPAVLNSLVKKGLVKVYKTTVKLTAAGKKVA